MLTWKDCFMISIKTSHAAPTKPMKVEYVD